MRALLFFLAIVLAVRADEQDDRFAALPAGQAIIDVRGIESFVLGGKNGTLTIVDAEARNFAKAARVRTETRPANTYELQLGTATTAAVKKGDKLLAIFEARAVEPQTGSGIAETEFIFEQAGVPYQKSAEYHAEVGPHWRRFYVSFVAAGDYDAGRAQVNFRAGYDPQALEIGAVRVLDYGPAFDRDKLPCTPASYGGREPDAAWRAVAAERIERLRKGDLSITVLGSDRVPFADVKVSVRMVRSAFAFGTAIDAKTLARRRPRQ